MDPQFPERLAYQAEYENARRWLSLDLLCGRVGRSHPWYAIFLRRGISEAEREMFLTGEATPDIIGILMPGLREALERHRDHLIANRHDPGYAVAAE